MLLPQVPSLRSVSAGLLAAMLVLSAPTFAAEPATLVRDGGEVALTETDSGSWTADVAVINVTNAGVPVTARPQAAACTLSVGEGTATTVPAASRAELTVAIPRECGAGETFAFSLAPEAAGAAPYFSVTAVATLEEEANWAPLKSFLWAFVFAVPFVFYVYLYAKSGHADVKPGAELSGLESTWTFTDSWISNITAGSGLVVAILGSSELLTSVLGEKAKTAIAVTTVAGVIAVALIAAAGVVVMTFRNSTQKTITVGGLCLGAVVALTAAGGQIWAVALLLDDVDLGTTEALEIGDEWIMLVAITTTVLLLAYTMSSMTALMRQGTEGAPVTVPSVDAVAAAVVPGSDGTFAIDEKVLRKMTQRESAKLRADEPTLAHRSAML